MSDLLINLNKQQQKAVLHLGGPAIVLAGAGSGKTRVLTTRAAWLIKEKKINPNEILLVTFTNKAAQEMNQRVYDTTRQQLPFAGTFHRICAQILRTHGHLLGLDSNYTIYDTQDQEALIRQIYKQQGFDPKRHNPRAVKAAISTAKNQMLSIPEYQETTSGDFTQHVATIYGLYQRQLTQHQAVDFDDLLLKVVALFQQHPEILIQYQDQIKHVLVDEYQDTNKAQYFLTRFLAKKSNNLYVVGDFSQSIYAWRGADYRNLEYLKKDFQPIKEYRLERNYRSTQTILDAASQIISNNTSHPILHLWTDNKSSDQITCFECPDGESEADVVLKEIQLLRSKYLYSDMAILYRTNAQSRPFEEAFVRVGLPYRIIGGFKFYERKEVKDLLAYLILVVNPSDSVSRTRAEKIGKRRLKKFDDWLKKTKSSQLTDPFQVLTNILSATQFLERFSDDNPQDLARRENVQELLNVSSKFSSITVFLENVALVQDNHLADVSSIDQEDTVTLISLHSAKGLEFPVVFMVGMEDGLLPHSRSLFDATQMEEERRLCYVGITRAKEKLYFSYALKRFQYGKSTYATRSRFLNEIDAELLDDDLQAENINASFGPKKFTPKRKIVIDQDALNDFLNDKIDAAEFLKT